MTLKPNQYLIPDIFKSTKLADLPQSNRPSFMKIHNYKSFNKLPYDSLDFREDLIRIACEKHTNQDLIKYTKKKVFFLHPTHKRYACDIFGSVFDLKWVDQPQKMVYNNTIFITCSCGGGIEYDYLRFKSKTLPIRVSDKLKRNYESTRDEEINKEENEKYELEKQMKSMAKDSDYEDDESDEDDE